MRAYAEETNRLNHERRAQAETSRRALEKIERSIKGIMDAIEDGMYQPAMKARMNELEQQKAEIEARLAEAPADVPDVHPNIAEHYRAKVIRLAETLAEPESNAEAREDIRSLVGEVVITAGQKRGESHAILRGELMAILDLAAGRRRSPKPEVITNALAGPRFEPTAVSKTVCGECSDPEVSKSLILPQKFPVLRNVFPVNSSREFVQNRLQHGGFLTDTSLSKPPKMQNSLQNSLLAGNLRGDGCDQHCVVSQHLERFQAKWRPVRVKKTRQIKNLEPRFDSIETEKALANNIRRADEGSRAAIRP